MKELVKRIIGLDNIKRIIHAKGMASVTYNRFFKGMEHNQTANCELKRYSVDGRQVFFGYYDKTPFSIDNNKMLAMVAPPENRPPGKDTEILVGYFSISIDGSFHPVGKTSTWCWQQGCRLQWFPGNENENIVYNKMVKDSYGAVIQHVENKEVLGVYDTPVYDIDNKGKWALTLNFSRLQRLRPGYGYMNLADSTRQENCPENDGVWLLDMKTGKKELLFSLKKLSLIDPLPSMDGAQHYINHFSFSPSGNRFMFFHLWVNNGRRYSRLFTSDLSGGKLFLLTNEGKVSHYTWKSDEELLVYYIKNKGNYCLFRDQSDYFSVVGEGVLQYDGHPSYSPDGNFILTDTYPDRFGERSLLLYSPGGELVLLGKFLSLAKYYDDLRCDLHPRWDRTGRFVCFDSTHEGSRAMYVMFFNDILAKNSLVIGEGRQL